MSTPLDDQVHAEAQQHEAPAPSFTDHLHAAAEHHQAAADHHAAAAEHLHGAADQVTAADTVDDLDDDAMPVAVEGDGRSMPGGAELRGGGYSAQARSFRFGGMAARTLSAATRGRR